VSSAVEPGFRSWFNDLYWARREPGAANAQNRNVSKSFFLLGTPCATVADSTHHTDAGNLAQRHRPIAFAAEGLRLALCFAFNCGIQVQKTGSHGNRNFASRSSAIRLELDAQTFAPRKRINLARYCDVGHTLSGVVLKKCNLVGSGPTGDFCIQQIP
jgi:hypothetical protein